MATRRRGSSKRAGQRRTPARRGRAPGRRTSARSPGAGAREARREEAARQVEPQVVPDTGARPAGERNVPGLPALAIELAIGAMRLTRRIATAPLRLGLALLRPREAGAAIR